VPADAVWAYCVAVAGDPLPAGQAGVDPEHPVERVETGGLSALVSRVPLAEFGEAPLREHLNDFAWLERVARRHEAVLEASLAGATIVPLRLCTIFAGEDGVRRMLTARHAALTGTLDALAGHQEWTVKLLLDRSRLEAAARAGEPEAQAAPAGSGAAYLGRRRTERRIAEAADDFAAALAEDVHSRLRVAAVDAVLNAPQNPELSGHEGEMVLNGAYLVDGAQTAQLRELVAELQARHGSLGARLELRGPLPPFTFAGRLQPA
jgi:hypothetical protein